MWSCYPKIAAAFALDPRFRELQMSAKNWNDVAYSFKQEFDDEKQHDQMLQHVTNFRNEIGPFDSGPFYLNGRDFIAVLWHFDSTKPWKMMSGIDNDLIAKLARYAIDIGKLEKFHRQYRDIQSHHRNKLGPTTQDNCRYKWNSAIRNRK